MHPIVTKPDLDIMFTYHQPNDETAPKYKAVRDAEQVCLAALAHIEACVDEPHELMHNEVTRVFRAFVDLVVSLGNISYPWRSDAEASVMCARLARSAANEGIRAPQAARPRLFALARTKLQEARWLACAAIACSDASMTAKAAEKAAYLDHEASRQTDLLALAQRYPTIGAKREETAALTMDFGGALTHLKAGDRVAREGWNGKGMWLALSCGGSREVETKGFWSPQNRAYADANGGTATVLPCITMKTATGEILMGWLASQSDMLATDWVVVTA